MITADILRTRRLKAGISQAALAKLINYRAETINRFERKKRKIPVAIQWALEKVLQEKEQE